jgi:hypothetical protein
MSLSRSSLKHLQRKIDDILHVCAHFLSRQLHFSFAAQLYSMSLNTNEGWDVVEESTDTYLDGNCSEFSGLWWNDDERVGMSMRSGGNFFMCLFTPKIEAMSELLAPVEWTAHTSLLALKGNEGNFQDQLSTNRDQIVFTLRFSSYDNRFMFA